MGHSCNTIEFHFCGGIIPVCFNSKLVLLLMKGLLVLKSSVLIYQSGFMQASEFVGQLTLPKVAYANIHKVLYVLNLRLLGLSFLLMLTPT